MKTAITVKSVTHLVETGCADLLVEGILKLQAERDAERKATFEAIRALQEARDEISNLKDSLSYVRRMRTQETLDLQEMSNIVNEVRARNALLIKVGDAMDGEIRFAWVQSVQRNKDQRQAWLKKVHQSLIDWNEAKEGKPSV